MDDTKNPERKTPMSQAVLERYSLGEDDEAMEPMVLDRDGTPVGRIGDGDYVIFYDIRGERERKGCGALTFAVTESRWEGDVYHQVSFVEEEVDAPAPVRKIFGETQRIQETARWVKGSDTVQIRYQPSIMSESRALPPLPKEIFTA